MEKQTSSDAPTPSNATPVTPSAEYVALLEKAKATDFSSQEYAGMLHERVLSQVGTLSNGAALFCFCPAVLGHSPDLDKLLLFFLREFDPVINGGEDSTYAIIFCQSGMTSFKGIGIGFLRKVYNMLGRRFKKNIKGLYILHPTTALKTLFFFAKPFISKKFWRKVKYFYHHKKLLCHDVLSNATVFSGAMSSGGELILPVNVLAEDDKLPLEGTWAVRPYPIRFFGCPSSSQLENTYGVPAFLCKMYQLLLLNEHLTTEGIFRVSGDADRISVLLRQFELEGVRSNSVDCVQKWYDGASGETKSTGTDDDDGAEPSVKVHIVSNMLKGFLRNMVEPLFPNTTVYVPLSHLFKTSSSHANATGGAENDGGKTVNAGLKQGVQSLFSQVLSISEINNIFLFLIFFNKVCSLSNANRMTSTNIAVVLAPNVLRPPPPPPLDPNADSAMITERSAMLKQALENAALDIQILKWLIEHVDELFVVHTHSGMEVSDMEDILSTLCSLTDGGTAISDGKKLIVSVRGAPLEEVNDDLDDGGEIKKDDRRSGGVFNKVTSEQIQLAVQNNDL